MMQALYIVSLDNTNFAKPGRGTTKSSEKNKGEEATPLWGPGCHCFYDK